MWWWWAGEGGVGGETNIGILYGLLVKTRRDLWVSCQSTFIILVLIFDSHGLSFFPILLVLEIVPEFCTSLLSVISSVKDGAAL